VIDGASGPLTITVGASDVLNVSSVIDHVASVGDVGLTKKGGGTLTLSAANTYTSADTISAGILSVNTVANAGSSSSLGTGSTTPAISISGTGTLQYTGSGDATDRAITLTATASATVKVIVPIIPGPFTTYKQDQWGGDPNKALFELNTYIGRLKKTWKANIAETSHDQGIDKERSNRHKNTAFIACSKYL
jgi:autotransporter-associated beta strand protein